MFKNYFDTTFKTQRLVSSSKHEVEVKKRVQKINSNFARLQIDVKETRSEACARAYMREFIKTNCKILPFL